MRASPVGEGWARAAAVWCVERLRGLRLPAPALVY